MFSDTDKWQQIESSYNWWNTESGFHNQLQGRDFAIKHVHNGTEISTIDFTVDGEFAITTVDKLSEFVFVYESGSLLWAIILLAIANIALAGLLIFKNKKAKKVNATIMSAAIPPYIFGQFIPVSHIVLVVILLVVLGGLIAANFILPAKGKKE